MEGVNPQAANLVRENASQAQLRSNAQDSSGQGQLRQDNAGANAGARPVQDVSVQISQQGLESAAAVSGQSVSDASAADTNPAVAASAQQEATGQVDDSAANRAEETNSPDNGSLAGNQSVSANESLGTTIDLEA